jgi:hypothetical protein
MFCFRKIKYKINEGCKSRKLNFLGSKAAAPAKEAVVEIVLDNKERVFFYRQRRNFN